MIATSLITVDTKSLYTYLADYIAKEPVELILIQVKQNVDLIAATILLQEYLNNKDLMP